MYQLSTNNVHIIYQLTTDPVVPQQCFRGRSHPRYVSQEARFPITKPIVIITFGSVTEPKCKPMRLHELSGTLIIPNRKRILRIYKEGQIVIDKEGTSFKIRWTVKLDTLYFIALCPSVILGIIIHLTKEIELVYAIMMSLAFFGAFIFMGILLIKYKFTELIYNSVYVNYKA